MVKQLETWLLTFSWRMSLASTSGSLCLAVVRTSVSGRTGVSAVLADRSGNLLGILFELVLVLILIWQLYYFNVIFESQEL